MKATRKVRAHSDNCPFECRHFTVHWLSGHLLPFIVLVQKEQRQLEIQPPHLEEADADTALYLNLVTKPNVP